MNRVNNNLLLGLLIKLSTSFLNITIKQKKNDIYVYEYIGVCLDICMSSIYIEKKQRDRERKRGREGERNTEPNRQLVIFGSKRGTGVKGRRLQCVCVIVCVVCLYICIMAMFITLWVVGVLVYVCVFRISSSKMLRHINMFS